MGNKPLKRTKDKNISSCFWKPERFRIDYQIPVSELFAAIDANDYNRVRQLLKTGHKINKIDANGLTALHLAAINGSEECVQILIEFKAELKSSNLRQTPLHFAAINGTTNMINTLIDYGSLINFEDYMRSTPLTSAVDVNNEETVSALLQRGAVLHPKVCVSALQNGFCDILRLLLNSRPKIIESIDLKDFCFTRKTVCGLKMLYFCGFPLAEKLINHIQPLNWRNFYLSGQMRLPPEHYNQELDSQEFKSFSKWLNNRSEPKPLKCLARIAFRNSCIQNNIEIVLNELNIPNILKDFLLLKDIK